MWTELHSKLARTLKTRQLLPPKAPLLVAVSGGQDSLCLLKLLLDLQPKWGWYILVGHCDHGWEHDRGIADHVGNLCQSWGVPFRCCSTTDLPETEAAAREWRYRVLQEIALEEGLNPIVTGHTLSDRAETFLYNLMRGAGTDGLGSLTWERFLSEKEGGLQLKLVRPLLNVKREETATFCQRLNIPIWADKYNENLHYARNRIRGELIPYIQQNFNRQIEKHLTQTAEILEEENKYLEAIADVYLRELLDESEQKLNRRQLEKLPLAIQRRVIRQFLAINFGKTPNYLEIETIINLLRAANRTSSSSLRGGFVATVRDDWIVLGEDGEG